MEKVEQSKITELEKQIKQQQLSYYILEEENSLLKENLFCLLNEHKNILRTKEEVDKIMSGKIYKILKKLKKIIK